MFSAVLDFVEIVSVLISGAPWLRCMTPNVAPLYPKKRPSLSLPIPMNCDELATPVEKTAVKRTSPPSPGLYFRIRRDRNSALLLAAAPVFTTIDLFAWDTVPDWFSRKATLPVSASTGNTNCNTGEGSAIDNSPNAVFPSGGGVTCNALWSVTEAVVCPMPESTALTTCASASSPMLNPMGELP